MSGVACAKAAEGARGASQHPKLDSAYLLIAYRMDATPLLVSAVQNASNQTKMSAYSYGNGKLRGTWTYPGYGSWLNTQ